MSDSTIVISGGGSYAVATDDQLARVQRLEAFADTARTIMDQLASLQGEPSDEQLRAAAAPPSALAAGREIDSALATLSRAASHTEGVAKLTRAAMLSYGETANRNEQLVRSLYASIANLGGLLLGAGVFVGGGVAVAAMGLISPSVSAGKPGAAQKWINDHPGIYSSPAFVEAVKLIVDATDNAMFSAGYLPLPLVEKLKQLGVTGPAFAAAVLIATGTPLGKLKDSDVALAQTTTRSGPGSAPTGWADRIARIPDTAHNGGYQIRIDKFTDASGRRSFEVYLSGTQTFSTSETHTPFDMTSNMKGIAGQPNASLASVEKAMRAAGIRPGDPVNITGHSQGGLIAHEVAASGRWNVQVALEAGPPASQTTVPAHTTEVVIAHNEDVVTALGGSRTDDRAIVVHASAFPDGNVPTGESTPPAHNTHRYEHTASLLDHASSSEVTEARTKANLGSTGAGPTVTTTLYKAERVWSK